MAQNIPLSVASDRLSHSYYDLDDLSVGGFRSEAVIVECVELVSGNSQLRQGLLCLALLSTERAPMHTLRGRYTRRGVAGTRGGRTRAAE